jgi:hypothetical protein
MRPFSNRVRVEIRRQQAIYNLKNKYIFAGQDNDEK